VESTNAVLGKGVNARMDINEMTAKNKFSILSHKARNLNHSSDGLVQNFRCPPLIWLHFLT